jgi:hypothetical protein
MTPHEMGKQAIDLLEERMASVDSYAALDTEQLGDFWLGMTEACTLRLVNLKPEIVRKVSPDR